MGYTEALNKAKEELRPLADGYILAGPHDYQMAVVTTNITRLANKYVDRRGDYVTVKMRVLRLAIDLGTQWNAWLKERKEQSGQR